MRQSTTGKLIYIVFQDLQLWHKKISKNWWQHNIWQNCQYVKQFLNVPRRKFQGYAPWCSWRCGSGQKFLSSDPEKGSALWFWLAHKKTHKGFKTSYFCSEGYDLFHVSMWNEFNKKTPVGPNVVEFDVQTQKRRARKFQ